MSDLLFEPGEYIPQKGPGYFTIAAKPEGRWREASYELQLLPEVVKAASPAVDSFITQAVFGQRNRRAVNMTSVGLLFADLDTYHTELKGKPPEEQAAALVSFCAQEGIPAPSIVLFSGRGLQAKWLLTEALGPEDLPAWNAVQIALVTLLEPFAADHASKDISRVLRLDQTVNTKSDEVCRIVYTSSGVETILARYDFVELHERLTGRMPEVPETGPQPGADRLIQFRTGFSRQSLNWTRMNDLRRLWTLRGGSSQGEGRRELTLFWELNFLLLAQPGKLSDIWREAQALASQIDPRSSWYRNSDLSNLYRLAKDASNGLTVEYRGRQYTPMRTPRSQTLIELFEITSDEERQLRTIISQGEKARRRIEKRRAEGVKAREQFLSESLMRSRPWDALGISRRTWYRKLLRK